MLTKKGYRVHPWTLISGGYSLKVELSNGRVNYTRNTKKPLIYIKQILKEENVHMVTDNKTGHVYYQDGIFREQI